MALIRFLIPLAVVAFQVYALVDVILVHEVRVRALNKFAWVVIVLFLPVIGAILWFTIGKERGESASGLRGASVRDTPRVLAPDDDPVFLHNATRFEEQEARIRRLEAELAALDDDQPKE